MITNIFSFALSAIVFFILSFFIDNIWRFYVPSSLLIVLLFLLVNLLRYKRIAKDIVESKGDYLTDKEVELLLINSSLIIPKLELKTVTGIVESSASVGISLLVAGIYLVVSLFKLNYLGVTFCAAYLFILYTQLNEVFLTNDNKENCMRFVSGYLRAKRIKKKSIDEQLFNELVNGYEDLVDYLKEILSKKD